MPSADETRTTYLIEVMPDTTQDFLARDVDLLVSQIKENLRLSSLKAKSSMSHKNRTYPYQLPSRSWSNSENCELCSRNNTKSYTNHHHYHHHHHHHHYNHKHNKRPPAATSREEDDSYLYFRELLREGSLIKEAVKRLHQNFDELESSEVEEVDVDEDEDEDPQRSSSSSTTSSFYRRKPYFYDSEDEPLPSSGYEPLEL